MPRPADGERLLDRMVAAVATVGVGAFWPLPGPFTTAVVIPIVLLPLWWGPVMRSSMRWIVLVNLFALVNGVLLAQLMTTDTRPISQSLALSQVALLVSVALGACTLFWARRLLGSRYLAVIFGVGVLLGQLRVGLDPDNPWKFSLFLPVLVILLGLASVRRTPWFELGALGLIAAICVLQDSRSAASIVGVALVAMVWQRVRVRLGVRSGRVQVLATLGFVGTTVYLAMQSFLLEGYLGAAARERTQEQIDASGSVLLGGRPEIGATVSLLQASPWGYGTGILPSATDVWIAKSGMASLNYDPNNGYVERYMFGNGMEVHSLVGDLWLRHGLAGLVFIVAAVGFLWWRVLAQLADGTASALVITLTVLATWDALFSPFYLTAIRVLILALALTCAPPAVARIAGSGGVREHRA